MTGLEIILTVLCVLLIGALVGLQARCDRIFEAFAILTATIMQESEWTEIGDVEDWIDRVWNCDGKEE